MKASIRVNRHFAISPIDPRIYGSFVEQLGRAVYGGIYEPGHPSADDQGFRRDVIDLVKSLNVPIIRYPGGNFVSGYCWEDGIGDRKNRPRRMELAWQTVETNQVGIDEFQEWAGRVNAEVMMAVNLGTRGPEDARNCVEYCNGTLDTHYANLRRKNGFEKPFGVKTWCLGNEMDGPWQICSKTAEEYGRIAAEAAKMMKWTDPSIELVACGSSGPNMASFAAWDSTVLRHTYPHVDYISLHCYYGNFEQNSAAYLGKSLEMDRQIRAIIAVCDAVKAQLKSDKTMNLSFDEWNVWYESRLKSSNGNWQIAPSQIEDTYTFEDALLVGCLLMTLQNHSDRVKMACLAQLVNVIAPIMTENGGKTWVQTTFYPFFYAANYGLGTALQPLISCDHYATDHCAAIPYLEASAIYRKKENELVIFAVNRSLEEEMELEALTENLGNCRLIEHVELYSDDLKAVNTKENQKISPNQVACQDGSTILLKKHSWNMLRFQCE